MHLLGEHFLDARVLDFEGSRDGNFMLLDSSQCERKMQVSTGIPYSAVRAVAVEWVPGSKMSASSRLFGLRVRMVCRRQLSTSLLLGVEPRLQVVCSTQAD